MILSLLVIAIMTVALTHFVSAHLILTMLEHAIAKGRSVCLSVTIVIQA